MFLVVGALGTLLQRQTRSGRAARAPLAAFLLVVVAWSFFGNTVLNDIRYLLTTAVAGALVGRRLAAAPAPVDLDRDVSRAGAA
jgi:hypothetical protein